MKLTDYIFNHYRNNKAAFARSQGITPQALTKWINAGFIVTNGVIYSPRRELKGNEE